MAKEIEGVIQCPHCGGAATVHRNGKASRLLYYRCGEVYGGASTGCGTVQIYGKSGQVWLRTELDKNRVPDPKGSEVLPVPVSDPVPDPLPNPVPVNVSDPVLNPVPKPKSVFSQFADFLGEV